MTHDDLRFRLAALLLAGAAGFSAAPASAGPGHDHGGEPAPAGSTSPGAAPRLTAESESFELVGVLEGNTLALWLDRWSDNAPVSNARLELDVAGRKVAATATDDAGRYVATLAAALPDGVHPVTATVSVAGAADLLAGELDVHASPAVAQGAAGADPRPADARAQGGQRPASRDTLLAGAVGAAVALGGAALWRSRRVRSAKEMQR